MLGTLKGHNIFFFLSVPFWCKFEILSTKALKCFGTYKRRKLIQKEKENIVRKHNHIYSRSLTEAGFTIIINYS